MAQCSSGTRSADENTVLHLASYSSLNLYSYRCGPYICEFHTTYITKKNLNVSILSGEINASGYLMILQWILCFVVLCAYRALNPKGTTLSLVPYRSVSFLLGSLYTEVLYVIKISSPKRHLPWFWVTKGGGCCERQLQCLTTVIKDFTFFLLWAVPSKCWMKDSVCTWNWKRAHRPLVDSSQFSFCGRLNRLISLHICQVAVPCVFNQLVFLYLTYQCLPKPHPTLLHRAPSFSPNLPNINFFPFLSWEHRRNLCWISCLLCSPVPSMYQCCPEYCTLCQFCMRR